MDFIKVSDTVQLDGGLEQNFEMRVVLYLPNHEKHFTRSDGAPHAMQVVVVKYREEWPQLFKLESEHLKSVFGNLLLKIHHIGSTAVPGLHAKPIIDMMLEVTDLKKLASKTQDMEALGYEVMGEFGIPGRRYFRKGGDQRTHHVHAFASGNSNLVRHLAFRDYLIAHPEVAAAYGKLKSDIALKCNNDIDSYGDQKEAFVKKHEALALQWHARIAQPDSSAG